MVTIGSRTAESFAVATIDNIIEELQEEHDVLKYIKIDKSQYEKGSEAINIMPEINNIESYKLGKAIREIIKEAGEELDKDKKASFIEDFKRQLGDDYLLEIEKIGVNLHFLDLKFA